MNAYINDPMCMGTPASMTNHMTDTCSMSTDPLTGNSTGYSRNGQYIAAASGAVPTPAPNMMYPSFNSSSLPMGYIMKSTFSTTSCMSGTLTAASGNLTGQCTGSCSGKYANCTASVTFVDTYDSYYSYYFYLSYVEFSSPDCSMNSMIGYPEKRYVSSYCLWGEGVEYTYHPMYTVPQSIVDMLATKSPGGITEL